MAAKILPTLLLLTLIMFSCSDEDPKNIADEQEEQADDTVALGLDSTVQRCDSVFIATHIGTACCISGPMVAKPGDYVRYHYQMNHRDAKVDWQIFEGDITIIAGQGTRTVTVQFGPKFFIGNNHRRRCRYQI